MDPLVTPGPALRFGAFQLDLRARELRKSGHRLRLQEHSFKILTILAQHPGEVVTREELRRELWSDGTVVDFDNGVNAAMGKLRQALRDTADHPRYIETIPRVGYRFIAEVSAVAPPAPAPEVASPVRARRHAWLPAARIAAAILLAALGYLGYRALRSREALPERRTLAVLPFLYLDSDPDGQYLADGLTEELTAQLARLEPQRLAVIARTSAMVYRGTTKNVAAIGQELGADHLLEGSIRRSGGRVRVTAQLIRASDQTHVWAGDYDRDLGDVLNLQSEIARAVADLIRVALSSKTNERLSSKRSVVPRAYDAYLKGRYYLWNQEKTNDAMAKAMQYFQEAIAADPDYAPPYAALAECYSVSAETQVAAKEDARRAQSYATKALALDDNLAEAHMVRAFMAIVFERDWKNSGREFQRALELDPNLVRARALHAVYLLAIGRAEEAVGELRRAQQLDPLSLVLRHQTTRTLYMARRFQETIDEGNKRLEVNPAGPSPLLPMAMAYAQLGRSGAALDALSRFEKGTGRAAPAGTRACVYAWAGQPQLARQALDELLTSYQNGGLDAYWLAAGYAALGDREQSLSWLEKAWATNDPYLNLRLNPDPALDGLRSDPRFRDLVRRMQYPR